MGNLVFQATLGGQVNLVGPNTASTFNLNVPAVAGTLVTTGDTGTVTSTMLASSVYTAPGTIGSGTPNTGAFTTLAASSTVTLSGGTANGVAYLNGSKVLTTGSALVFDGANLGLGVTPSAWGGSFKAIEFGGGNAMYSAGDRAALSANAYYNGSAWTYKTTGGASRYEMVNNQAAWYNAASGTAGNTISFAQAMTLDASGNLLLARTSGYNSGTYQAQKFKVTGGIGINSDPADLTSRLTLLGDSSTGNGTIDWSSGYSLIFSGNGTERARIDSSGNLLVGTTSAGGTGTTIYKIASGNAGAPGAIYFNGSSAATETVMGFQYNGGAVGSITRSNVATVYLTASDYRLKENVAPMIGALATVLQLKPVTYTWKTDGSNGQGFIAHELQAVVPDCVAGEKDAVNENGSIKPQGIDTSFLVATLTAAIQELNAKFEAYKATHP